MNLQRFDNVAEFVLRAEPFLLAHEAAHCLPLGILSTLQAQKNPWGADAPYLALVEDAGKVVIAAVRTPPYGLIVTLPATDEQAGEALALVATDVRARYGALPGVNGPVPISRAFAEQWQALTGAPYSIGVQERIYQLDAVIPVLGVSGAMRPVASADRDLLARWMAAFNSEALGKDDGPEAGAEWADRALATDPALRSVYFWEDEGVPVALAGYSGPTAHGMRIGPVYTPPERRGRGYASAVTAALSQLLLDGGRQFCFLFTDLANPTANKIYQQIGYRPVVDVDVYQLDLARSEEK